ncbi:MAG: hypothetical protein RIR52_712, partial [Acidobacteriota bacterium]
MRNRPAIISAVCRFSQIGLTAGTREVARILLGLTIVTQTLSGALAAPTVPGTARWQQPGQQPSPEQRPESKPPDPKPAPVPSGNQGNQGRTDR